MTLVFTRAYYVGGRLVHYPGDEVPPGLFDEATIDSMLDARQLAEYERPSLYRLFARFTGAKEQEPLTSAQIAAYALEE